MNFQIPALLDNPLQKRILRYYNSIYLVIRLHSRLIIPVLWKGLGAEAAPAARLQVYEYAFLLLLFYPAGKSFGCHNQSQFEVNPVYENL